MQRRRSGRFNGNTIQAKNRPRSQNEWHRWSQYFYTKKTAILLIPLPRSLFLRVRKGRRRNKTSRRGGVERATDAKNSQDEGHVDRASGEERGSQESCKYPIIGGYCGIITPLAAGPSKSWRTSPFRYFIPTPLGRSLQLALTRRAAIAIVSLLLVAFARLLSLTQREENPFLFSSIP